MSLNEMEELSDNRNVTHHYAGVLVGIEAWSYFLRKGTLVEALAHTKEKYGFGFDAIKGRMGYRAREGPKHTTKETWWFGPVRILKNLLTLLIESGIEIPHDQIRVPNAGVQVLPIIEKCETIISEMAEQTSDFFESRPYFCLNEMEANPSQVFDLINIAISKLLIDEDTNIVDGRCRTITYYQDSSDDDYNKNITRVVHAGSATAEAVYIEIEGAISKDDSLHTHTGPNLEMLLFLCHDEHSTGGGSGMIRVRNPDTLELLIPSLRPGCLLPARVALAAIEHLNPLPPRHQYGFVYDRSPHETFGLE